MPGLYYSPDVAPIFRKDRVTVPVCLSPPKAEDTRPTVTPGDLTTTVPCTPKVPEEVMASSTQGQVITCKGDLFDLVCSILFIGGRGCSALIGCCFSELSV
jgi:hypothetical protein